MALFARRRRMEPDQRETRQTVIKLDLGVPRLFVVALPAGHTLLPLMHVVLSMARNAGGCDLLRKDTALVTIFACGSRMSAAQREIGLGVVIERRLFPAARAVARLT